MYTVRTGEQTQRFDAFERLTEATAEVLGNARVADGISRKIPGLDIEAINAKVFLPNFKNGKVSMPLERVDTEGIPVIPISAPEASQPVSFSPSVLTPTPSRRRKTAASLEEQQLSPFKARLANLMGQATVMKAQNIMPLVDDNVAAFCSVFEGRLKTGQYVASRPVIFIDQSIAADPGYAAGVMAHEQVHAYDFEEATSEVGGLTFGVFTELRAHLVSSAIFRLMGSKGSLQRTSHEIDRLRQLYLINRAPQKPGERLPKPLKKMLENYINVSVNHLETPVR